jgi:hypothetical protein
MSNRTASARNNSPSALVMLTINRKFCFSPFGFGGRPRFLGLSMPESSFRHTILCNKENQLYSDSPLRRLRVPFVAGKTTSLKRVTSFLGASEGLLWHQANPVGV